MSNPILIIDAGHGGKDPGGGSNHLWLEKDKVLKISLYQYARFKALGVGVALTRDKDVYLAPKDRTDIVRSSGAKYCISNHINAGGGDGAEVIHSIYADSALSKLIADEIKNEGQNIRRIFTRTLPYNDKKDYYYMHRDTGNVDTLIVEYGFADSKLDDIPQIEKDWEAYSEAVVKAFCKHIGHPYLPPNTLPDIQRPIALYVDDVKLSDGYLIDNLSYIPIRAVAEALNLRIEYDGKNARLYTKN